jgi:hypothetical protein
VEVSEEIFQWIWIRHKIYIGVEIWDFAYVSLADCAFYHPGSIKVNCTEIIEVFIFYIRKFLINFWCL